MKAIVNTKLVMEDGIIWDGALTMDGGRIVQCGWAADVEIPANAEITDAGGLYTTPGFVDVHNHGGNGAWFYLEPERAAEFFLKHGETTILPTLYFNLDRETMLAGAERIRRASRSSAGKNLAGLYMEGPYMNTKYGSDNNNIKWKEEIDPAEYALLVDTLGDFVKVWCVAPEREGIEPFMQYALKVNPNVVFSIGHSVATPEQIYALKRYGLVNETHHANNGAPKGLARGTKGTGPDEVCLYDSDFYAELICDSQAIHVRPFMLRLVLRIKGTDRVILITDSCPFDGQAREGVAQAPDLGYDSEGHLAGSKITMDQACRNLMKHTAYGLCHAIKFATINPARMARLDREVGSLEPGKKANVLIMDDMVNIRSVFLEGEAIAL
ncbi:MAG TPA: amidohydrolase family protein [Feifaniaceae bacterium]|nr:amidohydrolase family protein [Feifaniaceae bacterium]